MDALETATKELNEAVTHVANAGRDVTDNAVPANRSNSEWIVQNEYMEALRVGVTRWTRASQGFLAAAVKRAAPALARRVVPDTSSKHTPGPWRLLEIVPAKSGGLCGIAPEGHATVTSDNGHEPSIEITSTTENMEDVYGSGFGGHIAVIPLPFDGRAQALANANTLLAAPRMLDALKVIVLDARARAWFEANDPQALMQAERAIAAANGLSVAP
jgi:hypothetical protein